MRFIILLLIPAFLFLACQPQRFQDLESIRLDGVRPQPGRHCESSALMNVLNYQGYPLTEEQILGAGSALGFVFELTDFPFLGGRNYYLKETCFSNLGIPWQEEAGDEKGDPWRPILSLLKRDIPVVLRVDMRYLPYLYNGRYGPKQASFGWHIIALFAVDADEMTALVSDTALPGLQQIALKDLHRARFSKTKIFPPEGRYYWVEKAPSGFSPDWREIARRSLGQYAAAMSEAQSGDNALAGLGGLEQLPSVLSRLDERVPAYLLQPLLEFHYGCIETNGTGGAAFREPYLDFIRQSVQASGDAELAGMAAFLQESVGAWHSLAAGYREAAGLIKKAPSEDRKRLLAQLAGKARLVYEKEALMVEAAGKMGKNY